MIDTDFLFLTSMLRAREAKMLSTEKAEQMLNAAEFDDAAKILTDCGYPDVSGMDARQVESVLAEHRKEIFDELAQDENARCLVDIFRIKYDYHNVKALVKSAGTRSDVSGILSDCGRVRADTVASAFTFGKRQGLPPALRHAMRDAAAVLTKTQNPQLADIAVDTAYFRELTKLAQVIGDGFVLGYARLLIDCANLRVFTRAMKAGYDRYSLKSALISGGNADTDRILSISPSCDGMAEVFTENALKPAAAHCRAVINGGAQTRFELECDNALTRYVSHAPLSGFGPSSILAYLVFLEWEITAARLILTGKLLGISTDITRERLRDCYV